MRISAFQHGYGQQQAMHGGGVSRVGIVEIVGVISVNRGGRRPKYLSSAEHSCGSFLRGNLPCI